MKTVGCSCFIALIWISESDLDVYPSVFLSENKMEIWDIKEKIFFYKILWLLCFCVFML